MPAEQGIVFEPIAPEGIREIEPWFDDPQTQRYLGGRAWLLRTLVLAREVPGAEFLGRRVLGRYIWVVRAAGEAHALVDVEPYDDGTAGLSLVVAPSMRGRGIGRRLMHSIAQRPELAGVKFFVGAIEPTNLAAKRSAIAAGFAVADREDEEGMLRISRGSQCSPGKERDR